MDKTEMLPCPFCDSYYITTELDEAQGDKWGYTMCACGAHGTEVRTGYDRSLDATWRDKAIKAWNTRTHLAEIEAMARDASRYAELCRQLDAAIFPNATIYNILEDTFEMGSSVLSIHLDAAMPNRARR